MKELIYKAGEAFEVLDQVLHIQAGKLFLHVVSRDSGPTFVTRRVCQLLQLCRLFFFASFPLIAIAFLTVPDSMGYLSLTPWN